MNNGRDTEKGRKLRRSETMTETGGMETGDRKVDGKIKLRRSETVT